MIALRRGSGLPRIDGGNRHKISAGAVVTGGSMGQHCGTGPRSGSPSSRRRCRRLTSCLGQGGCISASRTCSSSSRSGLAPRAAPARRFRCRRLPCRGARASPRQLCPERRSRACTARAGGRTSIALVLLPFLRERMRTRGDAVAWLGGGVTAGLALVAAATLKERAIFTGLVDFTTDYRVVGTFSSMHVGGGHTGAFIAMALPFLLVCLLRPRPLILLAMFGVAICAGYALVAHGLRRCADRGPGTWEDSGAAISGAGVDEDASLGWLKRPVELALLDPVPGSTIEIGHIRTPDPQGRDTLADGDFSRGTERWYSTDDQHLIWRIKNQYLMSLFDGGALGLAPFVLLAVTALAGAVRAMGWGDRMAAAVAASLVAFVCSGLFDYLREAPTALMTRCVSLSVVSRDRSASRSDQPARPGSPGHSSAPRRMGCCHRAGRPCGG